MSTPNPLVPQGSLQQQSASRNRTRMLVFGVIAIHVVALGGLLFQGCSKPTDSGAGTTAGTETPSTPTAPLTDPGLTPTNASNLGGMASTSAVPAIPVNNTGIPGTPGVGAAAGGIGQPPTGAALGGTPGTPSTASYVPGNSGVVPTPTPSPITPPAPVVAETITTPAVSEGGDYKIAKGDTLAVVAKKHGVTLKALEAANPGVDSRKLKIGQSIKIPAGGKSSAAAPATTGGSAAASATDIGSYKVKKGDSLTGIAKKHGTTVKELRRLNGLKTDQIKVDQTLKVPVKAAPAPVVPSTPEPVAPVVPTYTPPVTTPSPVTGNPGAPITPGRP